MQEFYHFKKMKQGIEVGGVHWLLSWAKIQLRCYSKANLETGQSKVHEHVDVGFRRLRRVRRTAEGQRSLGVCASGLGSAGPTESGAFPQKEKEKEKVVLWRSLAALVG